MTQQITAFLLQIIFMFLAGAALLRAYANSIGAPLNNPFGHFILALTDWAVRPLRRVLPPLGRTDWASLLLALSLCLLHALLLVLLFGSLMQAPLDVLTIGLLQLARVAINSLLALLIVYALLSWLQPNSPLFNLAARLVAPLLAPLQRIIPLVGGIDLSPLVLIVLLQIGLMLLTALATGA